MLSRYGFMPGKGDGIVIDSSRDQVLKRQRSLF